MIHTPEELRARVGRNVRLLREVQGLRQVDLAQKEGIGQPMISALEKGKTGWTDSTILALAAAFGVDPEELFRADPTTRSTKAAYILRDLEEQETDLIATFADSMRAKRAPASAPEKK